MTHTILSKFCWYMLMSHQSGVYKGFRLAQGTNPLFEFQIIP
jgi:hypothetical protein